MVKGFVSGLHSSPSRGFSVEFAEHRAYRPGDDLRFVDWKKYGRSDRFFLKQFEEETNLTARICLDVSRSMDWCSRQGATLTKLEYAKRLTASLTLLLIRQGDLAGLLCFAETVLAKTPPRGTLAHWTQLVRQLAEQTSGQLSAAERALDEITSVRQRNQLVVLVSDLLVDEEATRRALAKLRHLGNEVLVFHILDPGELELPGSRDAVFVDPETGDELAACVAEIRSEYRQAVTSALEEWRRSCGAHGIDYYPITTDQPLSLSLAEYLHTRSRLP